MACQNGADSLAASEKAVAHRLMDGGGFGAGAGKVFAQRAGDKPGIFSQVFFKVK